MVEKKFHIPSMILSAAALLISIAGFAVEGTVFAIISLAICVKKRNTHCTKIGVALSAAAIAVAVVMMIIFARMYAKYGVTDMYWLFSLLG